MRPWLALMVLGDYQIQNGPLRSFAEEGVDYTIEQEARERRESPCAISRPPRASSRC